MACLTIVKPDQQTIELIDHTQPNERGEFGASAINAQRVFNNSALPKINTGWSKSTALPRTNRVLCAPCVTSSLAVYGEPDA